MTIQFVEDPTACHLVVGCVIHETPAMATNQYSILVKWNKRELEAVYVQAIDVFVSYSVGIRVE